MTEYHQTNGRILEQNGHSSQDLESSIISLISSNNGSTILNNDEPSSLKNSYRKSAKLFINKRFAESYEIVTSLLESNVDLFDQQLIDQEVYINIWSLYFNLIDIVINKKVRSLGNKEQDQLEELFFSNVLFNKLYATNQITPPKLVLLLSLIKLNNEKTDLVGLRQQLDLYLVHASKTFSAEAGSDYYELLEVYYGHILVKLGKIDEAEYLIKSDPNITDPNLLISKVRESKANLDEEAKKKKQLEAQKKLQKQKKKDQKLKEQREARTLVKTERNETKETQVDAQDEEELSDFATVLSLIKKKFWFLKFKSPIVIGITLLALLLFGQRALLLNNRVRETVRLVRNKILSTVQMAFQVTYV